MALEQKVYSVLIVNTSENFDKAIRDILPPFYPITWVDNIAEARRKVLEHSYDFIIVNSPLRDSSGSRFALDCTKYPTTVVLFLCRKETYEEIRSTMISSGVFVLPKPLAKNTLEYALNWLASARERLKTVHKKTTTLQEKMEEIKIVNRAKFLLISERFMSEEDAHHYIEKQAMDLCTSKKEVALKIIEEYK